MDRQRFGKVWLHFEGHSNECAGRRVKRHQGTEDAARFV